MKLAQAADAARVAARNLALGGNLLSLTLVRRPREMVDYASEAIFLFRTYAQRRGLPQRNVFEVLPSTGVETVRLGGLRERPTIKGEPWFHPLASYTADLLNLCLLCRILKPACIFEIGTYRGYTAFHLAMNSPDDAEVYTLDLPTDRGLQPRLRTTPFDDWNIESSRLAGGYHFSESEFARKITCLYGDSADFDFSPFINSVDLFFIDGAHSYEYARSDTQNAFRCCHPGSVIAWHDFARPGVNGVSRLLLELAKSRRIYSVPGGSLAFTVVD